MHDWCTAPESENKCKHRTRKMQRKMEYDSERPSLEACWIKLSNLLCLLNSSGAWSQGFSSDTVWSAFGERRKWRNGYKERESKEVKEKLDLHYSVLSFRLFHIAPLFLCCHPMCPVSLNLSSISHFVYTLSHFLYSLPLCMCRFGDSSIDR